MPTSRPSLAELEPGANFIRRHIGPDETETLAMLKLVGASSLDDFIDRVIPKQIRAARPLDLPKAKAERSALSYLRQMGERFARAYPKVAGRLELQRDECPDPHVERLIESFAFLERPLALPPIPAHSSPPKRYSSPAAL